LIQRLFDFYFDIYFYFKIFAEKNPEQAFHVWKIPHRISLGKYFILKGHPDIIRTPFPACIPTA